MSTATEPTEPSNVINEDVLHIMNWANRIDDRTLVLACTHAAHRMSTGRWPAAADLTELRQRIRVLDRNLTELAAVVARRLTFKGRAQRLPDPQAADITPLTGALHRTVHGAVLAAYTRRQHPDATDWVAPLEIGYRETRRLCEAAAALTDPEMAALTRLVPHTDDDPVALVAAVRAAHS